jgi:DNA-binding GntR family transcriptional regulator
MDADLYAPEYTAAALAYQELKTLLLLGDVPVGIRLREERLADRLGMSRTPVREALLRLHAERFVDRHPEGGYKAANPSAQTMRELYEIRRALELFALRRTRSSGGHDRDAIEELKEEWVTLDCDAGATDAEFVHLDEDFHRRLAESAGNRELAEALRSINERIRPVRSHDFITVGRISATIEQHLQILDAVLARRIGRACTLLESHISESQSVVEFAVARVLERMLSVGERDSSW